MKPSIALRDFFNTQKPTILTDPHARIRAAAAVAVDLEAVEELPVAVHILHLSDPAVYFAVQRVEHVTRHVAKADVAVEIAETIVVAETVVVPFVVAIMIDPIALDPHLNPAVVAVPGIGTGERRDRRRNPQSQGR